MRSVRTFVEPRSENETLSWSLVLGFLASAVTSLLVGDHLWALYGLAVVVVALVPTVRTGTADVVAWTVLALAAAPLAANWAGFFGTTTAYVAVATLALLVVVEVDAFSTTEMPPWFAALFVVLTTLSVAALWGVVQYFADVTLGTTYLADRQELMWDLVAATAAGVGAGVLFELFFRAVEADDAGEVTGQ